MSDTTFNPPPNTCLMEVIRTTEKIGSGDAGDPVHRHIQYWTTDGKLLADVCDRDECDWEVNKEDARWDPSTI